MSRVSTKIGDVFSVKIDEGNKKYFQLIAFDLTQLNSDVIRSFKKIYPIDVNTDLSDIVNGDVEFYAHCVTKLGLKMSLWEKVGNTKEIGMTDHIVFRTSGDYGNPQVRKSTNWWIWKIDQERKQVAFLTGENRSADIGIVVNPYDIVERMKTGKYDFFYPDFE